MKTLLKKWNWIQRATIGIALLYSVVFILMLIFRPGSKAFYHAFNNVYQIFPPTFAGICGILFACKLKHLPNTRRIGWLCIGMGGVSFAAGQAIWTYYESIRGIEVPFPGWADAGYLGAYPFIFLGVMLLFGNTRMAGRARVLLDSLIAASGVGMLSWDFLIQRLWMKSDVSMLGKIISVAYPLSDIAIICGALVLLGTSTVNKTRRSAIAVLAAGMVLIAFFDSTFTLYSLNNTYQTGSWFDWTISFGWIFMGFAALIQIWGPTEERNLASHAGKRNLLQLISPYVIAFTAFGVIAYHDYHVDHKIETSTMLAGLGLILLVIARQIFTMLENLYLTENLEKIVDNRTRQLSSLHALTAAVNNTLQTDEVLAQAAKHTCQALQADAVAIWLLERDEAQDKEFLRLYLHQGLEGQPEVFNFINEQPMQNKVDLLILPSGDGNDAEITGAFLRAPLIWQQRPLGMIGAIRWKNYYGSTEPALLESIGIEVGTALENARLYGAAVDAADRDHVTGLFNHRALHQRLEREIQRAKQARQSFALIMMDMNNFKLFNDTYGHPAGDQVLKIAANTMQSECEEKDILGRYGGDEFMLVLPDMDAEAAQAKAERIRDRMAHEGFKRPGEERVIPITLSLGIAMYPNDGVNRHELLTIADTNLYAAKRTGDGIMRTTENQRANLELRAENSFSVMDAMITAVDNKDSYTRRHSEDVTNFALWIAEELGLSEETMRIVRIGGLLHDVGKIAVPDEILRKPGRLTAEEFDIMKRHPHMGALIVGSIPGMEAIVDAVRSHHERWDGKGYPDALEGENTPLLGRILAVGDAFSAMTTDRPYRKGLDWDAALKEIRAGIGTQFDPKMAHAFLRAAEKYRPLHTITAPKKDLPLAA